MEEAIYLFQVLMERGRSMPTETVVYTVSEGRPHNMAVVEESATT